MRARRVLTPVWIAAAAALLVTCTGGGGATMSPSTGSSEASASPTEGAPAAASPDGPSDSPTVGAASAPPGVPADVWFDIAADAAAIGGVDPGDVRVVQAAAVEWSDGSLGCPEPGMTYTQAIVPGWQIVVEAGGQTIDYRATGPGAFRICPNDAQAQPTI